MPSRASRIAVLVAIGVVAGVLSGLFGVGGGVIVVPALMAFARMDQRHASATSLVAIAPAAVVGAITYAAQGEVHWLAALTLAVGSVAGAPLGARLLRTLPLRVLPWVFVGFIVVVLVLLFTNTPNRTGEVHFGVVEAIVLLVLGLLSGVLSGLVGVGGGVVIVPGLEVVLGAGDLLAKGTSLLTMVPTSVSGTIANLRRGKVDLRAGLTVGIAAAACSPLGALVARLIAPQVGTVLFAVFLVVVAGIVLRRGLRKAVPATATAATAAQTAAAAEAGAEDPTQPAAETPRASGRAAPTASRGRPASGPGTHSADRPGPRTTGSGEAD